MMQSKIDRLNVKYEAVFNSMCFGVSLFPNYSRSNKFYFPGSLSVFLPVLFFLFVMETNE